MTMTAHISTVPLNIVEDILFETCATLPFSPPFPLTALAHTCRALRSLVDTCQNSLLARLFIFHFDYPRAIAKDTKRETSRLADELRKRVAALNCVKGGRLFELDFDADLRLSILSTLYLMMLEDAGSNASLLYEAGLVQSLADYFCHHPLYAPEDDKGWPLASPVNALALALFAGLRRKDDINGDTLEHRETLLGKIRAFGHAQFRYPISLSPTPVSDAPVAAAGSMLMVVHYGRVIPLTPPPVAMSAAHILFGHWDAFPPQVTFGLLPDRAAAIAAYGPTNIGPTRADLHEIRDRMGERFSSSGLTTPKTWEVDWRRATLHASSAAERACYKLGSLSGHWAGSVLYPCSIAYDAILTQDIPPDREIISHGPPVFVHFREYVRHRDAPPLERPSPQDGWKHAWLPRDFFSGQKGVAVDDARAHWRSLYTEIDSSSSVDADQCWDPTQHVVIVGKTEERHAQAWGGFEWTGTVRRSDGQVVLLQRSPNLSDKKLVVGYLTADRQLVGHIMDTLEGYGPADFAAPFSLTRVVK